MKVREDQPVFSDGTVDLNAWLRARRPATRSSRWGATARYQKEDLKHKIQIKKNQMDSDKKSAIAAVMAAERTHEVGLFP